MAKLNKKEMLEEAERNGQIYRIKPGWKKYMIFAGVLMCIFIITIPLGIWFFYVAKNARMGLTDQGFVLSWMGSRAQAWDEIETFRPVSLSFGSGGAGLVGALVGAAASAAVAKRTEGLKGPLSYKRKGRRGWIQLPAHAIQNSAVMARAMERYTGLSILPEEAPAQGA